ncbi:MAG: hypothetical protein O2822_06270 [Chloroflexi bacterium]|nr:hypothetical protein [Chloroflexota bacterium]
MRLLTRHPDTWPIHARTRAVTLLAGVLLLAALWPSVDAHARAGAFFVHAVLRVPGEPLAWITADPVEREFTWPDGGIGVLTLPGTAGPHPVLLVVLGAEPAAPDEPAVVALRDGLARIGLGTLVVRSHPLIDGEVTPDEVPLIVGGFEALRRDPRVRPGRVGMFGLSTGGSLVLVAAAQPPIAGAVRNVFAMGGYHQAERLVAEVVSGRTRTPSGEIVAWTPHPTAVRVVRATLLSALAPADRAAVERGDAAATADARIAAELIAGTSLDRAEALLASFGPEVHARMAAISPDAHVGGLRGPLFLLHDRGDAFIPVTHTEALARATSPRAVELVDLFEHVEPKPANVRLLLRDGWRVLHLIAGVIEAR